MTDSEKQWRGIFAQVLNEGKLVCPRGLKTLEIENAQIVMPSNLFMTFDSRKLSLDYIRREFQWYLSGDLRDTRIEKHAKIWSSHKNEDGSFSSNYGHYLFSQGGLEKVCQALIEDPDSRRAVVTILDTQKHLAPGMNDVPCTYCISFRIRDNKLNMTVRMRSNDLWFGLGNDAPIFGWIHRMVMTYLTFEAKMDLELGSYVHCADSLHLYEPHWDKAKAIALGLDSYTEFNHPDFVSDEFHDWLDEVEL